MSVTVEEIKDKVWNDETSIATFSVSGRALHVCMGYASGNFKQAIYILEYHGNTARWEISNGDLPLEDISQDTWLSIWRAHAKL